MSSVEIFQGVTILVLGCGSRGEIYSSYALLHPEKARVVGIADVRLHARKKLLQVHAKTIDPTKVFADWRELLELPGKIADCVVISLPDKEHVEASLAVTNQGYHMLLGILFVLIKIAQIEIKLYFFHNREANGNKLDAL